MMPFTCIPQDRRCQVDLLSNKTVTQTIWFNSGLSTATVLCYCWLWKSQCQWRLLRGGRLIITAGTERMECHQTPGNHGNHVIVVFNTVPLIPLQLLPRAHPPQLRCHQPPVVSRSPTNNNMHFENITLNRAVSILLIKKCNFYKQIMMLI